MRKVIEAPFGEQIVFTRARKDEAPSLSIETRYTFDVRRVEVRLATQTINELIVALHELRGDPKWVASFYRQGRFEKKRFHSAREAVSFLVAGEEEATLAPVAVSLLGGELYYGYPYPDTTSESYRKAWDKMKESYE